jgi:hypothetical protein
MDEIDMQRKFEPFPVTLVLRNAGTTPHKRQPSHQIGLDGELGRSMHIISVNFEVQSWEIY